MTSVKQRLKTTMPWLSTVREFAENLYLRTQSRDKIFTRFYHRNRWGDPQSRSGTGSNLLQTRTLVEELPGLIRQFRCASLLDAPCGDFLWMSRVELGCDYLGCDIVEELVADNQQRYGRPDRRFVKLDLIADPLPRTDVVLCRDCLVHFSYADIRATIRNIRASGSTYLLTTTFVDREENTDIPTGAWRPLNLQRPPFNFPQPLVVIREDCPEADGAFADKCLALWRLADLNP